MNFENQNVEDVTTSVQKYLPIDIHDRVVEAYYGKMGEKFMRETRKRIHWICAGVKGGSVLDVGCSQGIIPILLAREGIKVVGIDTSSRSIEEATQYIASEPRHIQDKVVYINADFLSYNFEKLDIQTVIISEVLEHLIKPKKFVDAAAKILPNDGRLIVTVPFGINDFVDHKHTFYLLEPFRIINQYFEIQKIEILGKWLGIIANRRENFLSNSSIITFTEDQIAQLEKAFLQIERHLCDELSLIKEKLADANRKYRAIAKKDASSMKSFKELENIYDQVKESQIKLQNEYDALQQEFDQLQLKSQSDKDAFLDVETQLITLQTNLDVNQAQLNELNQKYCDATQQIHNLKQQLNDANTKYIFVTNQLRNIKQNESQKEEKYRIVQIQLQQARENLNQSNLKYHKITGEVVPSLKRELEKLRQQKIAADERVIKTRATLSFQLGYLLIEHSKSLRGLITLPMALWNWRKEVIKRRKRSRQRQAKLDITVSTPSLFLIKNDKQQEDGNQQQLVTKSSLVIEKNISSNLKELKVACIMDEFTFSSYQPEAILQQLTPNNWAEEMEVFQPELLFIESAWRGKDALWGNKVGHASQELQDIIAWCRERLIPTVFWNKEDPIHFETFLTTAKLFDYVFTTDIDCIHRYKAALGHDRVYLLPFACQPANNNPIEVYERKDAFCFAGAYYVKYPERTRDLGHFVRVLSNFRPLEIFDRNFGKYDPNYQFPQEYQSFIVGTLPFDQIDKAYKGYRYAINLNSIKQSQSMFARRVFELLASNTITVSNFSRGVRLLFGDLVVATDNGNEMVHQLNKIASDETQSRKLRLAGLRKVMQEHTYERRMAYVVEKVIGREKQVILPSVLVLAFVNTENELDNILYCYNQQTYVYSHLLVITGRKIKANHSSSDSRIRIVSLSEVDGQTLHAVVENDVDWLAVMMPQDYYGPNYLLDIMLATRYSKADVIGKSAYYTCLDCDDKPMLQRSEKVYQSVTQLSVRSAVIRLSLIADILITEWLNNLSEREVVTNNGLAVDEFNYCHNGFNDVLREVVSTTVDDLPQLNTGIGIDELLMRAEAIKPAVITGDECPVLTGKQLASNFSKAPSAAIKLDVEYDSWRVNSCLPDGKHEYLYETVEHSLQELGIDGQFKFHLEVSPGLNIQLVVVFLDAQKQKISHVIKHANRNHEVDIPVSTVSIRFGLRFYASGSAEIKGLVLGHRNLEPSEIIGHSTHLVLTNHYPSYEDLYRNGFVHSRVCAYRERNVRCDVFRLRPEKLVSYHEFEGVDVITGSQEALHKMLSSGCYKSILVHFLDSTMWEVLQHYVDRIKIVVWVHGSEIQPWHRRDFNNQTEEQRIVAKMKSEKRMAFWRGLLKNIPVNLQLVFVSKYFAEEVMEDLGFRIPDTHYTIIHNPINTNLFNYKEKSIEQRKKILSIRPYASAKYANDLSVQAILLLAQKPWFSQVEFYMIGDGVLFEETLEPLRKFSNVSIEQTFLKQDEIAALHKEYGIFLCPTRMDAQGVSRDEAMSSGLVPVTNAVAAIPEFVDATCGILAPSEGAKEMAEGIAMLFESPETFALMSKVAAERVRMQSDFRIIIQRELDLFAN